jgi:hypothetical protein
MYSIKLFYDDRDKAWVVTSDDLQGCSKAKQALALVNAIKAYDLHACCQ